MIKNLCSSDGVLSLIRLRIPVAYDSCFDSLFICVSHDSLLSIVIPSLFITRFEMYKTKFSHIYVKFVYMHIVIYFSQNFICSFKCLQCCLTSDKYIGIISKENELTLITCVTYVIYIN